MGPALSSCSSGPLCGPQGAAALSSQDSGHLLGRGLGCGWGRLQPAPPLEQIPEECNLGLVPQPWGPVTRLSSHPGTSDHSAKAGLSHKPPHPDQSTQGGRAGVGGRGHPPQVQLPQSLKPGRGQEVAIVGRVRPWGGGPGGQLFQPGKRQLLWVHPSLGRERAGSGHGLPGLGGRVPPGQSAARRGGRLYLALVPTLLQAFRGVPTEDPAGAWRRGCGWAWFGAEGLQGQLHTEAGHLPWVRLLASSSGAGPLGRRPSGRGTPGASRERGQRLGARGWVSGRHSSGLRLHMGDPWVRSAQESKSEVTKAHASWSARSPPS